MGEKVGKFRTVVIMLSMVVLSVALALIAHSGFAILAIGGFVLMFQYLFPEKEERDDLINNGDGLRYDTVDKLYTQEVYEEAFPLLLTDARLGNSMSQGIVGVCYLEGRGVAQDEGEGFVWSLRSAKQGDAYGQANVGNCYLKGISVEQDNEEAFDWFLKSAKGGNSTGQVLLGYCYEEGIGVAQDEAEGSKWIAKAAEQGFGYIQRKDREEYCYSLIYSRKL